MNSLNKLLNGIVVASLALTVFTALRQADLSGITIPPVTIFGGSLVGIILVWSIRELNDN